jgi:hypothetical protein
MNNGLLAPAILSFVFTPLVVTVVLLLAIVWKRMQDTRAELDLPGMLLVWTVREMPEMRREWGAAMLGELGQIRGLSARWRFALGCIRVALFPPRRAELLQPAMVSRSPVCGMLAVALPPLGLPFIYFATVIVEAIGGSPFTQSSRWDNPDVVMILVKIFMMLTLGCLLAGVPLGLAGWFRRERLRWLSATGMILSISIFGYFLTVMHFLAGED